MDYEKRYNAALERAKYALTTDMDNSGHWACTYIFPELKKTSAAEIIDWLTEELNSVIANADFLDPERAAKAENAIGWLKKQKNAVSDRLPTSEEKVEPKSESCIEERDLGCGIENNAPTGYGKYIDACLNEATSRYFADNCSLADVFYAGVICGRNTNGTEKEETHEDYKNIVGSIIYHDGKGLKATSKEKWNVSLGTPVAVVVIPASHMTDGKCRGMSLCNMSYKTPQTGTLGTGNSNASTNGTNLIWGVRGTDVDGITSYTKVKTTRGTNGYGYLPSNLFDGGYHPDATGPQKCVSPYNDDDSQNPAYLTAGQALADMDGKANTEALVSKSAIKDTYKSGSFKNVKANYPAAFACHLFSTLGTSQGDWYLPALGELGYLYARIKSINESLAALGTSAVQVGTALNDTSSLGYWCWSSSEYDTYYAWFLNFNGYVGSNYKDYSNVSIRVRAFAAFDI